MKFALEPYSKELMIEMFPLWQAHHAETQNKFYGPLDPDLKTYEQSAAVGAIRFFTARQWTGSQIELVGYQVFFVTHHPHSQYFVLAVQDILYLMPEFRRGFVGYKFIKWCAEQLRKEGIKVVHQRISARNDFGKILERQGYELEDLTYSKLLQEVA